MQVKQWLVALILLILLLGGGTVTSALPEDEIRNGPEQTESGWEAVLYDQGGHRLIVIGGDGIREAINVPGPAPSKDERVGLLLSPDRRYLVMQFAFPETLIADLATKTCCAKLQNPVSGNLEVILLGAFNPQSTHFGVGYMGAFTGGGRPEGGIAVVDAATGRITKQLPNSKFDSEWGVTAFVDEWPDEGGISFFPTCWGCEPATSGLSLRWNPDTDAVWQTDRYFDKGNQSQRLVNSGDYLLARHNKDFPLGSIPGMGYPGNVVEYYTGQDNPMSGKGQVVFHDPKLPWVPTPEWVSGGQAFLVHNSYENNGDYTRLVFRDGQTYALQIPTHVKFLSGTPDGWLMWDSAQQQVFYYRPANSPQNPQVSFVTRVDGTVYILHRPQLGWTIKSGFSVNINPPAPITCPGFMTSRLKVNDYARVTPGPANNVRNGPTLSAQKIGQIPGSTWILVLEGPVCADSMAWWKIDYNGLIGWTSEGTGNSYWIEPGN